MKIISFFPEVVERFYSNGIYIFIAQFLRFLFGRIPFSVGDIVYSFFLIYLLLVLFKTRKTWKLHWKNNLLKVINVFSIVYFIFHLFWGLNYYRMSLFEKLHLQKKYSDNDLIAFTEKLIAKTNQIQFQITHNKNSKISNTSTENQIFIASQNGYTNLSKTYSFLSYNIPSQKKSLYSLPLSYMGFSGYLNPFTNEAQVNDNVPKYDFPFLISHEMAHQIGYGSESECNFIGFLACKNNPNLQTQYAAYAVALHYCLNAIAMKNEKKFDQLKPLINGGILNNYRESELFWQHYDTFINKGFYAFYNQFLKANQQKDGMDSYNKFVDLLINYYKQNALS